MFGIRKQKVTEMGDAVCVACGAKCFDQIGLERHAAWAHPASKSPEKVGTSEKKG